MASHAHADHGHADHGGHDDHAAHSPKHYIRIWAILCVLLIISITGPMLEIQVITLLTAFGIAFVKAGLVVKHFMHLDTEKPVVWYMLITGIAFMLLFFAGVAPDVMNHTGARWNNIAAEREIQRGMAYGDPADHHGEHAAAADHAPAGEAAPAGDEAAPAGKDGHEGGKAKKGGH
jgi:caa(3)-type oxidase subunit IV